MSGSTTSLAILSSGTTVRCFTSWSRQLIGIDTVTALRRTLCAGGHVILPTFGRDGPTACSGLPVARYGADELPRILGPDFGLVSSRLDMHHTPAGRAQQFLYTRRSEKAL
jgi:hypothetical protein